MRNAFLLIALQPLGLLAQWTEQNSGVTDDLSAIQFVDASTGYCAGANGLLLKTMDGGLHWTGSTVGSDYVYNLYFLDADHGYVQGGGMVYRTFNGIDFEPLPVITDNIPPSEDTLDYHPVSAGFSFNGPIGVLSCSYTTTPQIGPWITLQWKTQDFGDTWEPLQTHLPGAVAILDGQHWFAAYFNMYESFDAGQTWDTSATNYFSFPPYGKDCFQILDGTGRGLIAMAYEMEFGRIHSFTDTMENVPELRFTQDIDVQAGVTRFLKWDLTSHDMMVLKSLDEGQTLLPDTAVLPGAWDMDFISDNIGWACGDSGRIWKYVNDGEGIVVTDGAFSIAPNPAHDLLRINVASNWAPLRTTVLDAAGRTVLDRPYDRDMDISALPPGSYVLILSDKDQRQSLRFTKE